MTYIRCFHDIDVVCGRFCTPVCIRCVSCFILCSLCIYVLVLLPIVVCSGLGDHTHLSYCVSVLWPSSVTPVRLYVRNGATPDQQSSTNILCVRGVLASFQAGGGCYANVFFFFFFLSG